MLIMFKKLVGSGKKKKKISRAALNSKEKKKVVSYFARGNLKHPDSFFCLDNENDNEMS